MGALSSFNTRITQLSSLQKAKNKSEQKDHAVSNTIPSFLPTVGAQLKGILMKPWNLIQNQAILKEIFKEPPMIYFEKKIP